MKIRHSFSKKILAVMLSLVMVFTCISTTVFAENISEDAGVQAAYDAYHSLDAVIDSNDYEAMVNAMEALDEITLAFNDAQLEEWDAIVEEKIGFEEYLDTVFTFAYISIVADAYTAYQEDKNIKTGLGFTAAVDECIAIGIDSERLDAMFENLSADYEEALANYLPAENVSDVYIGYLGVQDALFWGMVEDLQLAVENFPVDTFNELTEEEMAQLTLLLEFEGADETFGAILSDWVDANVILEVATVYDAYIEDANTETATAFIEKIDSYDEMYEGDRTLIDSFFFDISEVYDDAKSLLNENGNSVLGDVNNDTVIDASDALLVLQQSAKLIELSEDSTIAADVNSDNFIDASDALMILQYAADLINGFDE